MNESKVVLGLSGGVDSSVAARLLMEQGYEVTGLFLDIGNAAARGDAEAAAQALGIPLKIRDISSELEKHVCAPFAESYAAGRTPNPCVMCNPAVKFAALVTCADRLDARWIATGHYARAEGGALYKGRPENDQSYMLCRVRREQVERLMLPLGAYAKTEVRAMAEARGLPAAHKPDSMEICFIPDNDYVGWLEARGVTPPPGDIVFHDAVIGRHEGIHRWTVGQRLPGLYDERKLYVGGIDAARNRLVAVLWEELFHTEVRARDFRWLIDPPDALIRGSVRVRHTKWEHPEATVTPEGDGVLAVCDEPVRAPAPGQALAVYQGDRVIGGGIIC